ncbi:MAG: Arc family DNA-binding protein [Clostridia bacterium]|nr:Arc family DNA-binding protein [Clostridia bacterium]
MSYNAEYNARYKREKYDQIMLRVPKGMREKIAKRAAELGMSVQRYLIELFLADAKGAE